MRIGVYLRSNPEPIFREIELEDLLMGKNVREALANLGITEEKFCRDERL